jgi:pyruvate carboxylase
MIQLKEDHEKAIAQTAFNIREVTTELAEMLIAKNRAYGDSALNPQRFFSTAPSDEQIKVRLDDKLNRIRTMTVNGQSEDAMGEDVVNDLLGYLVLLRIAQKRAKLGKQVVAEDNDDEDVRPVRSLRKVHPGEMH